MIDACRSFADNNLAFHSENPEERSALVEHIGAACEQSGFFQLVNHGIPESLQQDLLSCSKEFFSLPLDVKETYDKGCFFLPIQNSAKPFMLIQVQMLVVVIVVTNVFALKTSRNGLQVI